MRHSHCLIIIILSTLACGGDEPDLCAAICDRERSCDGATTCDASCPATQDRLRPEARDAMAACFESLTCSASDDRCILDGIEAAPARAIDEGFAEECIAAVDFCQLNDDICGISQLFEQQHVETAIRCFDRPCDEVDSCLGNSLAF